MKIQRLLFLCLSAVFLLTACTFTSLPKLKHPPLKFMYATWPGYYPVEIAKEKGFFTQQGIEVKTFNISSEGGQNVAEFAAGKYDGMALALGDTITLSVAKRDMRVIMVVDESAGADAVVARPQIRTVNDLKGKQIGTRLGGFGELFVIKMLESKGMTSDDVKLINVDGEKILEHLQSGDIVAGSTWEPFISEAVKSGYRILFTTKQTPSLISDVIVFQGSVLRDRPDDVRAFIRAWFQAVDYWKANPIEGNAIAGKALKIPPETISLEGIKLLTLNDNLKTFTKSNRTDSLSYTTQLYVDFFIGNGVLTRPPEVKELLDPSFLK